jgi:hypothetical protein
VQELDAVALAELPGGSLETAFTATRRGRVQLGATADSIDDAQAAGEIDAATAGSARGKVVRAEKLLTSARNLLGQGAVPPPVEGVAAEKIAAADALLDDALDLLAP